MVQAHSLEEISLFDFSFEAVTYTDEEIQEAFALLVQRIKQKGNYYGLNVKIDDIKKYIPAFEDRKWLTGKQVRRDLLDYHTVEDVIENIENYIDELIQRIDAGEIINWYEDTWRTWNEFVPCSMAVDTKESQQLKSRIWKSTAVFSKKIALKLGLKHYAENPSSRGSVMNAFNSKGYKKHFIPYLESEVLKINDFDEMKEFFDCYFLAGRRDQLWSSDSSFKVAPYPEYTKLHLNELAIASLCETDESNFKEVLKMILKHTGISCAGRSSIEQQTVRYSPTFTYRDYINSLTNEDLALIFDDIQRLSSLHGKE